MNHLTLIIIVIIISLAISLNKVFNGNLKYAIFFNLEKLYYKLILRNSEEDFIINIFNKISQLDKKNYPIKLISIYEHYFCNYILFSKNVGICQNENEYQIFSQISFKSFEDFRKGTFQIKTFILDKNTRLKNERQEYLPKLDKVYNFNKFKLKVNGTPINVSFLHNKKEL